MTEKSDEFDFAKVAESGSIVIQHLGFGVSGNSRMIAGHINAAHESAIAEAVKAVVERCAKIAEEFVLNPLISSEIAKAIRKEFGHE